MNKHLPVLIALLGFGLVGCSKNESNVLNLLCKDDGNASEWNVVINKISNSITFYDRIYEDNFSIGLTTISAERVKTYAGNTTYYESITYYPQSKRLARSTTEVPIVENHPRLRSPETYSTSSTCQIN